MEGCGVCVERGPPVQPSGPGTAAQEGQQSKESHEGSTQALGEGQP